MAMDIDTLIGRLCGFALIPGAQDVDAHDTRRVLCLPLGKYLLALGAPYRGLGGGGGIWNTSHAGVWLCSPGGWFQR
jgi:hypothetical protein